MLFTPPPRRVAYLVVPIDPGRAISCRGLVCSRKHAYVEILLSLLLDPKLTVVICSCPFCTGQVVVSQNISEVSSSPVQRIIPCSPSRLSSGEFYTITCNSFLLTYPKHFSFFGTIARKASLLSTYAFYLSYSIGVQIVLDVLQLILFFRQSRETLIRNCIDGSTDQDVQDICNNSFNASKWTIVVSMVVGLIIQFCEFQFFLQSFV